MTKTRVTTHVRHAGVPANIAPKNGDRVNSIAVPCPDCKATAGETCIYPTGSTRKVAHRPRRLMAVRRANEIVDGRAAAYASSLSPTDRREARESSGLTRAAAAAFFGMESRTFQRMEMVGRSSDLYSAAYGAWLRLWIEAGR